MKKIILICTTLLMVVGLAACDKKYESDTTTPNENNTVDDTIYSSLTNTTDQTNIYSKLVVNSLETTDRQATVIQDTTVSAFYNIPGNGNVASSTENSSILAENEEIFNYDYLDENGIYYVNNASTSVQLFKHRGADSQVASYLEDDTAVTKTVTLRNSIYPTASTTSLVTPVNMTGLYAPAGELIKIEISEELAKLSPKVYIGATAINADFNDIPSSDSFSRMPNRVKELTLTDTVNYVGSPLGGQIYIQADMDEYTVTISGSVEYTHYMYGATTREDLVRLYDSTAPMVDIEIPGYLRINMPKDELTKRETEIYNELFEGLSVSEETYEEYKELAKEQVIDEIIELAETWKMYAELSVYMCPEDLFRANQITIFYDSYIVTNNASVGSCFSTFAIAQGRNLLNTKIENLSLLEVFNLHFWNNSVFLEQGSSDVTSKLLSILTSMLYGTYGEYRTLLSNSHTYSNAGDTLNYLKSTGTNFEIAKYITLVHSFGVETFIEAITSEINESVIKDRLYVQFSITTQMNMLYYFEEVLEWEISDNYREEIKAKNYDMYIPVGSNMQIGSVVNGEKIYNVQTYGLFENEVINVNESIIVPTDMEFEILYISNTKGNLTQKNGIYYYSTTLEEIDEFTVEVKVFNGDYSYTTTLLMGVAVQYSNISISKSTTTFYNNVDNLSLDDLDVNDLAVNTSFTLDDSILKYGVNTGNNGVFVTYAELYLPTSKTYTFNARGLGDIRVYVGTNYTDLEEVVNYKYESDGTTSSTASSYDITDEDRTFTIDAIANQRITIKIEISSVTYGTNERVEFYLGYLNGSSVSDIPSSWWYGQYTANPIVTTPATTFYNNPDNVSVDDVVTSELTVNTTFTLTDSQLKYGVNTGYNGLFVTYAEIHLPEATEYTFTACGMGDIRVYIGTDYDNLEEIVSFIGYDSYNNNPVFDVTNSAKTFTIDGTKSQKIAIKIVVSSVSYNSNQRVEFCLGYLNGDTVSEIPSDWWYGANSYRYDEVSHYYSPYTTQSLYEILQNTISTTTRIDEDLTIIYQTCNLDDKFLTSTNSSSQSMDPGSIVIYKYNKAVTANYFQVTSASDVDNVLAFFEIYVSDNGIQWTETFNGLCDFSSYSSAELNDGYTFQYVKLVFAEQYTGNYIDICNFEFQIRCEDLTIVDCPNDFSYSGNASLVGNNSNLNNNVLEFDNKIKFEFTGTSLLLFSNLSNDYGVIEVTVNEVTYQIDLSSDYDLYSQKILTIGCLEYDTYEVEIKVISGIGNLDYIAK